MKTYTAVVSKLIPGIGFDVFLTAPDSEQVYIGTYATPIEADICRRLLVPLQADNELEAWERAQCRLNELAPN